MTRSAAADEGSGGLQLTISTSQLCVSSISLLDQIHLVLWQDTVVTAPLNHQSVLVCSKMELP